MNKSLAIIIAVGLALGCDDPAVSAKTLDVLEFGAVQAKLRCEDVQSPVGGFDDCQPASGSLYAAHRLADGSALVTSPVLELIGRSESAAETMSVTVTPGYTPPVVFSVEGGELIVSRGTCSPVVVDIETECTGFNLDTFD